MDEIKTILKEQLSYLSKYVKDTKHTGNDVAYMTIAMILLSKAIKELQ